MAAKPKLNPLLDLSPTYALALCRIEPENNVEMILTAFSFSTKVWYILETGKIVRTGVI